MRTHFSCPSHALLLALASLPLACAGDDAGAGATDTDATATATSTSGGSDTAGGSTGGSTAGSTGVPWQPSECFDAWDQVAALYPGAGDLGPCTEVAGGEAVVRSLLVLDGITIDNNGQAMAPCVAARCDATHAYVATNALPHYDFVQTTPNPLVENQTIYQVPLAPTPVPEDMNADLTTVQSGCGDAYDQYLASPTQATSREPGHLCLYQGDTTETLRETLASGESVTYRKIACLGVTGLVTNGSPIYGPNEATIPDPFGSPLFFMPDVAGEPYLGDDLGAGAALDLCGGHTADSMHYHGINDACFAQADDGAPALSYVEAAQAWDLAEMLDGACAGESGVVGWSLDGYPIKGPCVCVARDGEGACTEVKRARSSWVYAGLGSWGEDPKEADALGVEGTACAVDDECCPGGVSGCDFRCSFVIGESDGAEGSALEKQCTLLDYSWCTHRHVDRSTHGGGDDFVYLDRCNGFEGPDGYAYHATGSFPYITACYRGVPTAAPGGGGGGGGMNPPKCMPGQTMCCGDGFCGGPETAANCPEDC